MANTFDQFDTGNPFDQFDEQPVAQAANVFDQFDETSPPPVQQPPEQLPPGVVSDMPQKQEEPYTFHKGVTENLAAPDFASQAVGHMKQTSAEIGQHLNELRKAPDYSNVGALGGAVGGGAVGLAEFMGGLSERFGSVLDGRAMAWLADYKKANPEASAPKAILEYLRSPTVSSEAAKALREALPKSPSWEYGETVVGAPFAILSKGLGGAVGQATGSPTAAGLTEEAVNIGAMAAPGAKSMVKGKAKPASRPTFLDKQVKKAETNASIPEEASFEPYTPDLFPDEGTVTAPQYGEPLGGRLSEHGIPYNRDLSTEIARAGVEDMFTERPETAPEAPQTSLKDLVGRELAWQSNEKPTAMSEAMQAAFDRARLSANPIDALFNRRLEDLLKNLTASGAAKTPEKHLLAMRDEVAKRLEAADTFEPNPDYNPQIKLLTMAQDKLNAALMDRGFAKQAESMKADIETRFPDAYKAGDRVVVENQGRASVKRSYINKQTNGLEYVVETPEGDTLHVPKDRVKGTPGPQAVVSSNPMFDPEAWKNLMRFSKGNESWNPDGTPRVWYHATKMKTPEGAKVPFDRPFTKISEMGFHVGDASQATARYKVGGLELDKENPPTIMPLYISSKNALRLKDGGSFDWKPVLEQLVERKLTTPSRAQEVLNHFNDAVDKGMYHEILAESLTTAVQDIIKNAGFDSIKYVNRYEGIDMQSASTAHIPDQVRQGLINKYRNQLVAQKINNAIPDEQALAETIRRHGTDEEFKMVFPEAGEARILFEDTQLKSSEHNSGEYNPNIHSTLRSGIDPVHFGGVKDPLTKLILGGLAPDMRHEAIPMLVKQFGEMAKWGDSTAQVGFSTASHRAKNALIAAVRKKADNLPTMILEAVVDNTMGKLLGEKHAIDMSADPVFKQVAKTYEIDRFFRSSREGLKNFSKDMKVLIDMERDPSTWFDGTNYYWTKDQLVAHGIPEARAVVLEKLGKTLDGLYGLLVDAAKMRGMKIPPRIPGWLPHSITGPYRSIAKIVGKTGEEYIVNMGSFSRKAAEQLTKYIESAMQQHPDVAKMTFETTNPKKHGNDIAGLTEGLYTAMGMVEQNKALSTFLKKIYENAEQGVIREALERKRDPMLGHDLERATEYRNNNPLGLNPTQQARAVMGFRKAFEDVTGFLMKVKFANHTLFPLLDSGLLTHENFSGFAKNIKNRTNAFLKITDAEVSVIDNRVKGWLISNGLNPGLLSRSSRATMTFLSRALLWGNIKFYAANLVQSTYLAGMMQTWKAMGMAAGERTGSITKAMAEASKDLKEIGSMALGAEPKSPILKWAKDHGHLEFSFMEMADPNKLSDPISKKLESTTRAGAFVTAYHYFKQFMTHEEALQAAGFRADQIGVSYNSQFGAPIAFQKIGAVERPIALFQTFAAHQFGILNQQIQTAALALKRGDLSQSRLKAFTQAASGIATFQAMQYALFGMAGVYLANNVDTIIKLLNQVGGWDIPTSQDAARFLDTVVPESLKGINTFGTLSKMAGYDISSSGQGLNFRMPDVAPSNLINALQAAVLTMRWAGEKAGMTNRKVTYREWKDATDKLPSTLGLREFAQFALKHDGYSDLKDVLVGDRKDWSASQNIAIARGRERTYAETLMALTIGLQSLEERSFIQTEIIDARKQKIVDEVASSIIDAAKGGKEISAEDQSKLMWMLVDTGKDPKAILDSIIKAQIEKLYDPDMKRAIDATKSVEAQLRYQDYLKERAKQLGQ